MPSFSPFSLDNLSTCHPKIQRVFHEVIKHWDCRVLKGHRGEEEQNEEFASGDSKLQWPDSEHNSLPSRGVDVVPWPVDWDNWKEWYAFSGFVLGVAAAMGITLISGLDWDKDRDFNDQNFNDGPHFQLAKGER